jgi:predicted RNA-binding Zn-ribbon protein involved in translation (DUF1610 family)
MTCPNCGENRVTRREHTSLEPHGEWRTDEWYECSGCGAKLTEEQVTVTEEA